MEPIDIPVPGLVVLVGAAGSGKTTLAALLFEPTDILSSDDLRAAVSGDAADQRATRTAFGILHREARIRLAAGRLVVVDATNVEDRARRALLLLARAAGVPAVAIVLQVPGAIVHVRNTGRAGRVVPAEVVDRHLDQLARLGAGGEAIAARLLREGFAAVEVVDTTDDRSTGLAIRRI
jgi:protein phosphatase